ncbi:hypothetical protein [Gordonibacter urolithinfaciens]|uniref:hypothetical protein n=1 Tax=Gordonibacter urolithinfaciens TaxID=1335613 RepID=UPI003A8F11E8
MTSGDAPFAEFRHNQALEAMLTFAGWQGGFSEADRRAMADGCNVIRTALVQPVGTSCSERVEGAVSDAEYSRAVMCVLASAMCLWLSGKLEEVACDG